MATEEFKNYLVGELKHYKEVLEKTNPEDIDEASYVGFTNVPCDDKIITIVEILLVFKERGENESKGKQ